MIIDLRPISQASVELWIESDSKRLAEYKIQVEKGRTTCFVPSTEGKKFSINWKVTGTLKHALRLRQQLDGVKLLTARVMYVGCHDTDSIKSAQISPTTIRPLLFGRLELSDDASAAMNHTFLGTIQLGLSYVKTRDIRETLTSEALELPSMGLIHEKTKKSGTHAVVLGAPEDNVIGEIAKVIAMKKYPKQVVVFQYAPEDYLRAKEIIPRHSQKPSPPRGGSPLRRPKRERSSSTDRLDMHSEGELSEGEVDADSIAVYNRVKAAIAAKRSRLDKKLKREPSEIPRDIFEEGECIDLTSD